MITETEEISLPLPANYTSDIICSDQVVTIFQWVNYATLCQLIVLFGIASNIMNIICFVKQGFKDSVNVSLLGLAVSDLGSLISLLWINLSLTPAFQEADLPFNPLEVTYLTASWAHVVFYRVTSWITALITLERCLCIIVPLKVKNIITPKRAAVIIVGVYTVLICSASPVYCVYSLGMRFNPQRNKSILGLVYTEDRGIVETVAFAVNNVFIPFTSFIIVVICTIMLVVELKRKTIWREKANATSSSASLSNRDQKVATMIVMISTLFIICFIPAVITFVAMVVEPEFSVDGKHKNMFLIAFGLGFTLESTNSSMNIVIYYRMSSRYRAVFQQLVTERTATEKGGNIRSKRAGGLDSEIVNGPKRIFSSDIL